MSWWQGKLFVLCSRSSTSTKCIIRLRCLWTTPLHLLRLSSIIICRVATHTHTRQCEIIIEFHRNMYLQNTGSLVVWDQDTERQQMAVFAHQGHSRVISSHTYNAFNQNRLTIMKGKADESNVKTKSTCFDTPSQRNWVSAKRIRSVCYTARANVFNENRYSC